VSPKGKGKGEVMEENGVGGGEPPKASLALRAFPWLVALAATVGGAVVLTSVPSIELGGEAGVPGEPLAAEAQEPAQSEITREPQSPYAHLQDQVVPRDMRTIHEGGPVGLLGLNASPDQTSFCDESNWSRMELVEEVDGEQFFVDQAAWNGMPIGTRAQLASWMSKCETQGDGVEIYGGGSGALLATYHPRSGLQVLD
jgi:hypothetical protein